MKTKSNLLIIVLLLGCFFVGCENYLDVTPKDKQTQEQLFATRSGFYAAVNGVYNKLVSDDLYGRNLSYEMIDLMAMRYAPISSRGSMFEAATYGDYKNEEMKAVLSKVWETAYATILNCNVVLENIEKQQGVLGKDEATLLKGEMLAMRAFLHFDMLRLFGPEADHLEKSSIPYNESTKIVTLPLLSAEIIINDKILRDLDLAEQLLSNDPIIESGPMASAGEDGGDVYLRYRQLRFNYYAVKALKARVLLYAGNKQKAGSVANELLEDPIVKQHFKPVDPAKLLGNSQTPDRVFSTEVLMGMYDNNRADIYTYSFDGETASTNLLQPRSDYVDKVLFEGEYMDYRLQSQWAYASSPGSTGYLFIKYRKLTFPDKKDIPFYAYLIPLIRLSEVLYIAAECESELSDRYKRLNEVRSWRGTFELPVVDESDFMTRLRTEYIREFYGEGQIFFMYKRLNVRVSNTENGFANGTMELKFDVPLPEDEIQYR